MKLFAVVASLSTLVCANAFADVDARGHINRLALTVESQALQSASLARQIYSARWNGGLNDQEVEAVASLTFVKDSALEFRVAINREGTYNPNPMQSRIAYFWLNRAFVAVERNAIIMSHPQLRGGVMQLAESMNRLRGFYQLAERLGWAMAEVVVLSEHLSRESEQMFQMAMRELNSDEEFELVEKLQHFHREVKFFHESALRYTSPVDARVVLNGEFRRIQNTYVHISHMMGSPRFNRFSPAVRAKFESVRETYVDLEYSFLSPR
jgi:hypothetical protein